MIEKVEILKDAAATALYGIQGGNGFAHQHGLSAQGGNDKGGFFAAVSLTIFHASRVPSIILT